MPFGLSSSDICSLLGSLFGGIIGAGGAILAVYILLARQRRQESKNVAAAVRTEVTALAKYIIESIGVCQKIRRAELNLPRQEAHNIIKNFSSNPTVYPAVADRIGLLPHSNSTVEFYMRLSETRTSIEMLRTRADPEKMVNVQTPPEYVSSEFSSSVANGLIIAIQCARTIIADKSNTTGMSRSAAAERIAVIGQIDECLRSHDKAAP